MQVGIALAVILLSIAFFRAAQASAAGRPRRYTVHPPKIPPHEKTIEHPGIKVPGSSAIQCYAPATGQFLGLVDPVTAEGIDRCIASAAEAQREWAKTTFAQRKAVLRSLLQLL